MKNESDHLALAFGICFLLLAVLAELLAILCLNEGHLVYTLDDPYIHLALAEHISSGHYGINAGEFSSPSSSILWPFILALFSGFSHNEYVPLIINIIAGVGTIFFYWKILLSTIPADIMGLQGKSKTFFTAFLLIVIMLGTNIIGLIFTGMEHSLQVFFTVLIIYCLIIEIEHNKIVFWLPVAIVAAPLIRYENLAISCAAILYLFCRKHCGISLLLAMLIIFLPGGFSFFLKQLGLGTLPSSVISKSALPDMDYEDIRSFFSTLPSILSWKMRQREGAILYCGFLCLMSSIVFFKNTLEKKLLAGAVSIAIVLHIIAGAEGWGHRYEIYIWTSTLLTLVYLSKDPLSKLLNGNKAIRNSAIISLMAGLGIFAACGPLYISSLISLPFASNNIYEQQYQMRRFAIDFYRMPVAVNDIGCVSFKNSSYVLDLCGLASHEALMYRRSAHSPGWMDKLSQAHNVQLIMIYDNFFNLIGIPSTWIKIGKLNLGRKKIFAADSSVAFYARSYESYGLIFEKLRLFQKTLPKGVEFIYERK